MASLIDIARRGPSLLVPHERGQVAHLVSTIEGARAFASAKPLPPAEWLCTFDPLVRFGKPGTVGRYFEQGDYIDPFDLYGIDSDPVPGRIASDDHYSKREVPASAWSAFYVQAEEPPTQVLAALTGHLANAPAPLTLRLWSLGVWLSEVCHQPAAVWWAAAKREIHPAVQDHIRRELYQKASSFPVLAKQAWRIILASWEDNTRSSDRNWYDLKQEIAIDGWSISTAERIRAAVEPRMNIASPFWGGPIPPENQQDLNIDQLFRLGVTYPDWDSEMEIPREYLASMVRAVRLMLEKAAVLETEVGGFDLRLSRPLTPDPDVPCDEKPFIIGLDLLVMRYVVLYRWLAEQSRPAAIKERSSWPDDDHIFARIRIWAAGQVDLTGPAEAGRLLAGLSADAFWDRHHQRDLLVAIEFRWNGLTAQTRKTLTQKLLKGPTRWISESKAEFPERRASYILERIHWLRGKGIHLPLPASVLDGLRQAAPTWREEYAAGAASSMEERGGYVRTDPTPDPLLGESLATLIDAAELRRGRDPKDSLLRIDPFQGYVKVRPVRALAALMVRTSSGTFPLHDWRTFLESEARNGDRPCLSALIAGRLATMSVLNLEPICHDVTRWIDDKACSLLSRRPDIFRKLWEAMLNLLRERASAGASAILHDSRGRDWLRGGINAPAGRLCKALFNHPSLTGLHAGDGLPEVWRSYVEDLLNLPGCQLYYVVAILSRSLNQLYLIDPIWTETHLIRLAESNDTDAAAAFWDGFMYGHMPQVPLYLRVKNLMLARVEMVKANETQHLSGILLAGWGTVPEGQQTRCVTNQEMRACLVRGNDEFRQQVLWRLGNWSRDEKSMWRGNVLEFVRSVWPRQRIVNGPQTTAGMCNVLTTLEDDFPAAVQAVLPRITPLDRNSSRFMFGFDDLDKPKGLLVQRFPQAVLELLYKVLPVDVRLWPYNTREVLKLIGEQNPILATDQKLLFLVRRLERAE
jgi:hypothetical protein